MTRLIAAAALMGLAACHGPPPARTAAASPAQAAACRQRADEVYSKQNRAELYRSDTYATDNRDSPFANFGLPGVTSAGLSGRYARDNLVSDCLNSSGAPAGGAPASGAPASAAASGGPAPSTLAAPPSP